jgi:hypothetical protein
MKRSAAVSSVCVLGVGAFVLAAAALRSPAYAQSADFVLCDRVAADPDPAKHAAMDFCQSDIPAGVHPARSTFHLAGLPCEAYAPRAEVRV